MFFNRYNVQNEEENEFLNIIASRPFAWAEVRGGNGFENVSGRVSFYRVQNGVVVFANIKNLPVSQEVCAENIFAMHIHEGEQCTGDSNDQFKNAKGHLNLDSCEHPAHTGDLEPLFAGRNGNAIYSYWTDRFTLSQIIGRVVIIHSQRDDFTTQPSGDSGTKIACGKIVTR